VGSSAAIAATGPAVLISYALAGLLILLVMRMLGEMALARPDVSSFTDFPRVSLGPWAGFTAGWLYWYFWIIVVPVEAIAGANILQGWFTLPAWQLGTILLAIITSTNLISTRSYGEVEFWLASIKVLAIIAFILLVGAHVLGLTGPVKSGFSNLVAYGGFAPHGLTAILAGVTTVLFSLTGAEIITIAARESVEPARAIAKMTSSVIVRIMAFYVVSILLIISIVPWTQIVVGQSPFTEALEALKYHWAREVMAVVILTAVLSCLNSAFYVSSRVLFTLARHADAPQWIVQVNSRKVPTRAVLIGGAVGVFGVLTARLAPQIVFAYLVNASGALTVFVYILTAVSQIRSRRDLEKSGAFVVSARMWWFPWGSYAAIGGLMAILAAMALNPDRAKELAMSVIALVVTLAAYFLLSRKRTAIAGDSKRMPV
jgi:L-asparagine transporter-like permease